MPLGKRSRRILKVLGWSVAGLLGLVLSLPIWFPWVLRPIARGQHISYARYERIGYSHFVVSDVVLSNRTLRIRAERLEGLVPGAWFWRMRGKSTEPFATAQHYEIE